MTSTEHSDPAAKSAHKKVVGLKVHEVAPRPPPTFALGNYQINWLSSIITVGPVVALLGAILYGVPLQWNTFLVMVAFYAFSGLGVTAGYHRLFSHRAYQAHWSIQWLMAFAGAGAFEGSIKWWGRNHRIHHRYIDTDKDPYNARRGFFFSHMGWMLMKQDYDVLGQVDVADLNRSSVVMLQHKFYLPLALLSGIILPTLVCGLCFGDWAGGYFYAAIGKMVFVHQSTFFINSLAHSPILGASQNFSDQHTSQDSVLCALVTLGEGYHNFHHEFAQDYRNGIKWYHWDPTKWVIRSLEILGLAKNLVRTPKSVIRRNIIGLRLKQHEARVAELRRKLETTDRKFAVPTKWTMEQFKQSVADGRKLIIVSGYVLDLEKKISTGAGYTSPSKDVYWYNAHPGGRKILDEFVGKDATEAMTGGIYKHSEGALNLLSHLRVASLDL